MTSQHKTGTHPFYIGMYIHIYTHIYVHICTSQKECLHIFHGLGGLSCFVKLFVPPRCSLDGRFPTPTRQMLVEMACNFDDCETTHSIALNPLRSFQLNFVTLLLACRPSKVWSGGSQCSSWWTLRSRDLLGSFWDSHSLLLSHVSERLPIHDVSCIWGRFRSLANLL